MHVALYQPALRSFARKGNFHDVQVLDREIFYQRRIDAVCFRDATRRDRSARMVLAKALVVLEKEIDRHPKRPGVLRPNITTNIAQLRHLYAFSTHSIRTSSSGSFTATTWLSLNS